jgi:hypothetical protein
LGGVIWIFILQNYLKSDCIGFITVFHLDEMTELNNIILSAYFSFTTLSSTGLGDLHPISNSERLFAALFMLFGTAIYSFVGGKFYDMIENLKNFDKEYNEMHQLQCFFEVMKKFNKGSRLPKEFEQKCITFFDYKWKNDRNYSIKTESDNAILDQLPDDVKMRIFRDFLYFDFLQNFRHIFRFKLCNSFCHHSKDKRDKQEYKQTWQKYRKYPYYDYNDKLY